MNTWYNWPTGDCSDCFNWHWSDLHLKGVLSPTARAANNEQRLAKETAYKATLVGLTDEFADSANQTPGGVRLGAILEIVFGRPSNTATLGQINIWSGRTHWAQFLWLNLCRTFGEVLVVSGGLENKKKGGLGVGGGIERGHHPATRATCLALNEGGHQWLQHERRNLTH